MPEGLAHHCHARASRGRAASSGWRRSCASSGPPGRGRTSASRRGPSGCARLRIELYSRRWDAARALARELPRHVFHDVCRPFDRTWVAGLPADLRSHALAGIVETATAPLEPAEEAFAMLEAEPALTDQEHRILVEQLVFRGRLDDAERRLAGRRSIEADVGRAFLALLQGRTAEAITAYEAALAVFLKMAGKRAAIFPDRAGLFFVVALMAEGSAPSLARAAALADAAKSSHPLQASYCDARRGRRRPRRSHGAGRAALRHERRGTSSSRDPIEILVQAAAAVWVEAKLPSEARAELEARRARAEAAGLALVCRPGRRSPRRPLGKGEGRAPGRRRGSPRRPGVAAASAGRRRCARSSTSPPPRSPRSPRRARRRRRAITAWPGSCARTPTGSRSSHASSRGRRAAGRRGSRSR